jgi:hypothetical protein
VNKTQWIPASIKPSIVGAYEIQKAEHTEWYRWFDGERWINSYWSTPDLAYRLRDSNWDNCKIRVTEWRGLKEST